MKKEGFPSSFMVCFSTLAEAVTASAMFAVAGVPDMNGRQFAVHAVAVVLAIGYAAGDAAVDVAHAFSSFRVAVSAILAKISESIDKR